MEEDEEERTYLEYMAKMQRPVPQSVPLESAMPPERGEEAEKKKKRRSRASNGATGEEKRHGSQPMSVTQSIEHLKSAKLVNGKDSKSIKFRERSDMQCLDPEASAKPLHKLGPLVVLPRRENQNEANLVPMGKRSAGEFGMGPRVAREYASRVEGRPMETLLSHGGFFSQYVQNTEKVLYTVSSELRRDGETAKLMKRNAAAMAAQQRGGAQLQLAKVGEGEEEGGGEEGRGKKKRKTEHGAGENAVTFDWDLLLCGYNNKTGRTELYETIRKYYAEFLEGQENFYLEDQLEQLIPESAHSLAPPRQYAMYRELERDFSVRYKEYRNIMGESASRVPKFDDEPPLSKEYIDHYRLRPSDPKSDKCCSRGEQCRFYTYNKKETLRYKGKIFQTPREKRDPTYVANVDRLCYDCIIYDWTERTMKHVAGRCPWGVLDEENAPVEGEAVPEIQFNYFTVLCEPGQYSLDCLLPQTMNGRPTGIVGCVPAYCASKRISVPIKVQRIEGNKFISTTTNYLAETGMDF